MRSANGSDGRRLLLGGGRAPAALVGALGRLSNRFTEYGGLETWLNLRLYPAVLALYCGGLGAVAANKLGTEALLSGATIRLLGREERPLILHCAVPHVVDERLLQPPGGPRYHTPASDRIADVLREPLREFLPREDQYQDAFDRFEYLLALAYADYRERSGRVWAPLGAFGWRQLHRGDAAVWKKVEAEAEGAGARWEFLQGRQFGGDLDRFRGIQCAFHEHVVSQSHW